MGDVATLAGSFFNRHALRLLDAMPSDCLHVRGFRVSFTPLAGVLFTVPSRYSSAIGRCRYYALEGGPPCFQRPSTSAAVLASHTTAASHLQVRASHPLRGRFPVAFPSPARCTSGTPAGVPMWAHNPTSASAAAHMHAHGLGTSPFARHYLGSRSLSSGY